MDLRMSDRATLEYLISELDKITKRLRHVRPYADVLTGAYPDTDVFARGRGDIHSSLSVLERMSRDLKRAYEL